MSREYFNAYHSILEAMEPLNDAERGRLFTALLIYSSTGATEKLSGNERFVFPGLRSQIDRDIKKYDDYCQQQSENGKKGGRPPKANESQKTQPFFEKAKKANEKEKEKEKTKEKEKENISGDAPCGDPPTPSGDSRKRFVPPTVEDVRAYCDEKGYTLVNPERFVNYYASNGWMVGKSKMKDWKSAVAGWQSREKERLGKEKKVSYTHGADRLAAMIGRGDFDD